MRYLLTSAFERVWDHAEQELSLTQRIGRDVADVDHSQ